MTNRKNCNGADWENNLGLVVSKVTSPRVNFVKSPYDDDFKAEGVSCTHRGLSEKVLPRCGGSCAPGQDTRRFHLCRLPIAVGDKAGLDRRLAAERGVDAGRADAGAEDVGLGRHVVPSRRQH